MNKIKFSLILIIFITIFSIASCANSDDWYPSGIVTISSFSEYTDGAGDKICTVFYSIENIGDSRILQNTDRQ